MTFKIRPAETQAELEVAAGLFREYLIELGEDLTYQNVDQELATLPGDYATPHGVIFLVWDAEDKPIGCGALRPLQHSSWCELKRMYVKPCARGCGIGKKVLDELLLFARKANYHRAVLDSLPKLKPALSLYRKSGFIDIPPYYETPMKETVFLGLCLSENR